MKKTIWLLLSAVLLLCGCSARQSEGPSPWPSHSPEATPYVRLENEAATGPTAEANVQASYQDTLRALYEKEGRFYFKDWELEMFKALPPDEPYRFAVYLEPLWSTDDRLPENSPEFIELLYDKTVTQEELAEKGKELGMYTQEHYTLRSEINLEYALKAAKAFADAGCESEVKYSETVQNGFSYTSYLAIVSTTPARLFELSSQMDDLYFIEQLYELADHNHNVLYWSSAEYLP